MKISNRIKVAALLLVVVLVAVCWFSLQRDVTQSEAQNFMLNLNSESAIWYHQLSLVKWEYETNLTNFNLQKKLSLEMKFAEWEKKQWLLVTRYPWKDFDDLILKRQFKKYSILGDSALPKDKENRLKQVVGEMEKIYSTTTLRQWRHRTQPPGEAINSGPEKNISLEPDLVSIFGSGTKNSCKLKYYWEGWYGSVGRNVKGLFEEYVNLANEAARLNNFSDNAAMWLDIYEMKDFEEKIHKMYLQILPLYKQLHAYIRYKLRQNFNTLRHVEIDKNGSIPAHLLGNVWSQTWAAIYNMSAPFPNKVSLDVTPQMKAQNYTPLKMFKLSEEFFLSLNLSAMTNIFWEKSVIEKPKDRELVCHASAWDFSVRDDFRIKMCTEINYEFLRVVHHEMGHIQYFQQYRNQPSIFRSGANPAFHEAIGDTMALSVSTAEHLLKIGLLDPETYVEDKEANINSLYLMALEKVAFLPFAYTLELWRWEVFRGNVTPANYTCRFWELRHDFGGVKPPVDREEEDFDPGAKYHVVADTPYIRYFLSFIIQFQFHKFLCIKAGQYDPDNPSSKPLHHCDIYKSTEAGNLLSKMLQMGSSKPWQDALEVLTGQRDMDAGPLLEYFQPLMDWLILENSRNGEHIGWENTHKSKTCYKAEHSNYFPRIKPLDECRYTFDEELIEKEAALKKYEEKIKQYEREGIEK